MAVLQSPNGSVRHVKPEAWRRCIIAGFVNPLTDCLDALVEERREVVHKAGGGGGKEEHEADVSVRPQRPAIGFSRFKRLPMIIHKMSKRN